MDATSSAGKKEAVTELMPLLSLLPDAIDRGHYVQKLSAAVGVDEKIVLDLLNRALSARATRYENPEVAAKPQRGRMPHREMLERRLLGLFLKFAKALTPDWQNLSPDEFSVPILRAIFEAALPAARAGRIDVAALGVQKPELASEIDLLVFAVENELADAPEWTLEAVKTDFLQSLKLASLKEKMKNLSTRIKEAETAARADEVKKISAEFNLLAREIAKYQAS